MFNLNLEIQDRFFVPFSSNQNSLHHFHQSQCVQIRRSLYAGAGRHYLAQSPPSTRRAKRVEMLCSLSGQIPQEPVVSAKSGHVFEKRLLLKYLEQNQNRCPVTNEELDVNADLVTIHVPTAAASGDKTAASNGLHAFSPEAAGIPQLLALFQNEWDATVLETFTLKQHLEKTRQELSHALYQHDAACRVIARLNSENASLRSKLSTRTTAASNGDVDMEENESAGLSAEAIATIEAKQKELAKKRKDFKKKDAPVLAEPLNANLAGFSVSSSHTIHDSDKPGVLAVAIDPKLPERVLTGGVDKHAKLFSTKTQQIVTTLSGHSKKVSATAFHPTADLLVTASHDKTVKLWSAKDDSGSSYGLAHTLSGHEDAVTGVDIHATGNYLISSSADASWAIADIRSGKQLARAFLNGDEAGANAGNEALCVQFHPDGGIFATGSKAKLVQMWDVKSLANVASFDGHAGQVNSLCFSNNGYQVASGSQDGVVKLWDLRKLKSIFEIDLNEGKKGSPIHQVAFDASGSYLAVASSQLQVLKETGKTSWEVVKTLADHKASVTGVQFAPDSSYLASTSMDRSLKLYR